MQDRREGFSMTVLTLRRVEIAVFLLVACGLHAAEEEPDRGGLGVNLGGNFHYGPVDGFLQTPAGGNPGSSSHHRPTLDELDIHDAVFYDVVGSIDWHRLRLFAGYEAISLDGDSVLAQSLVSRDVTFPAGTAVRSSTELNWLRVGAGWKFDFADQHLELVPKAELALLDFSYQLSGGGQGVSRSYAKGCVRLGLESRYRFNRTVSLSLEAAASLPLSNTPQIAVLSGGFQFDPLPATWRYRPTFFVGGGAQRIEYEDNQELPNHFRIDMGPFVTAGLGFSF